jgi:hypothetical protein
MKRKNCFVHERCGYPQACYYSQDAEPDNGSIEVNGIRMGTALFLNHNKSVLLIQIRIRVFLFFLTFYL